LVCSLGGQDFKAETKWTNTSWVLEEKAYACRKEEALDMLREMEFGSIGGIMVITNTSRFEKGHWPMLVKYSNVQFAHRAV